jgi:upstream-binding transcription factor
MATIYMTSSIETAIAALCVKSKTDCVELLAEKYKFDVKEAIDFLELNKPIKSGKKEKKEKKPKKEVDPNKPKKTSGYLLYSAEVRTEVKTELTVDGVAPKSPAIMSAIGAKWKLLSDDDKSVWNAKAKSPAVSDGEE